MRRLEASFLSKTPLLDLHGYKVEDVFDAVEAFLRRHQNARQVQIMPGKGTGKVRAEVERYLKLAGYHFKAVNDGLLNVFME